MVAHPSHAILTGNSFDELGVLGTNTNNGNRRVQLKDGLTNADVALIPVP